MNSLGTEALWSKEIAPPPSIGSYSPSDVIFLLKDISAVSLERSTEERERAIQSGVHYSEMLPSEQLPGPEYMELYRETLSRTADKVAYAAAVAAEWLIRRCGTDLVLVSLARGGTPAGILMKRYISYRYHLDVPHYSISILRGRGIDENALLYIRQRHGEEAKLQFVDGWTGKGAIRKVLTEACSTFSGKYGVPLDDSLTVLADPGHCAEGYGTREDFLVPSACLNATVSGLISRTVLRSDCIGPDEFHGAKFYSEWLEHDESNAFLDTVSACFPVVSEQAVQEAEARLISPPEVTWRGLDDVRSIQEKFGIGNPHFVKPGVGEATRVLLRRVPWKLLVDRLDNPNVRHLLLLAEERNVPVEVFPGMAYSCCGIIKPLKGDDE